MQQAERCWAKRWKKAVQHISWICMARRFATAAQSGTENTVGTMTVTAQLSAASKTPTEAAHLELVNAEILEISPARTDGRLDFIT